MLRYSLTTLQVLFRSIRSERPYRACIPLNIKDLQNINSTKDFFADLVNVYSTQSFRAALSTLAQTS
jgi:hypothetical protein